MMHSREIATVEEEDDASSLSNDDDIINNDNPTTRRRLRNQSNHDDVEISSIAQEAKTESNHVGMLRVFVFGSLITATIAVSFAMFVSTKDGEEREFQIRFADHSSSLLDAFRINWKQGIASLDSLATSIVTSSSKPDWPFVNVPNFEKQAAIARQLGQFYMVALLPLVTNQQRQQYQDFVLQNLDWMDKGVAYEKRTRQDQWEFGNFAAVQPDTADTSDTTSSTSTQDGATRRGRSLQQQDQQDQTGDNDNDNNDNIVMDYIWYAQSDEEWVQVQDKGINGTYLPIWEHSPVGSHTNSDLFSDDRVGAGAKLAMDTQSLVISKAIFRPIGGSRADKTRPAGIITYPLLEFDDDGTPSRTLGAIVPSFYWDAYMQVSELPEAANHIRLVLINGCDQSFTYEVIDSDVQFIGEGDQHDTEFNDMGVSFNLSSFFQQQSTNTIAMGDISFQSDQSCPYSLHIYPSTEMKNRYYSTDPYLFTGLVVGVFLVTSFIFMGYDCLVERRQKVVLRKAERSNAIINSLFPKNVRKRLLNEDKSENENPTHNIFSADQLITIGPFATQRAKLKSYVNNGGSDDVHAAMHDKPIADLFSNTTVLFADIAGFTAWSSTREPSQVFRLLESIYGAFDKLADRRRVFKVETIGDCYMAVAGLPDPQPDHAVIMAKFAAAALHKMAHITRDLEVELGPDTTDLTMRIGLHSGPVTAGVLRGQKSRFQLFGDTVNTASRMESTGERNRIQCSQETANILIDHGKSQWMKAREDKISAKGKGTIQTYWIQPRIGGGGSVVSAMEQSSTPTALQPKMALGQPMTDSDDNNPAVQIPNRQAKLHFERLVEWNVDLLMTLLKRIVAHQMNSKESKRLSTNLSIGQTQNFYYQQKQRNSVNPEYDMGNPRDEYREAIQLPHFEENKTATRISGMVDPTDVTIKKKVEEQLRDYVTKIASSYRDNPFHNYDHASHVTMSTNKILMRVVAAEDLNITNTKDAAAQMHNYTFGITSDPLTHFACIFAALIHDVDHPGVSNAQLIQENDEMAQVYNNKSVAEQNSLDLAWGLLMDGQYEDLRACLFHNNEQAKKRFRQLLVNIVMATDVFDPELQELRNNRWAKAFSTGKSTGKNLGSSDTSSSTHGLDLDGDTATTATAGPDEAYKMDLKATIVIEHILQAADVSHTMQHWHVYQKWNKRLFHEMYKAYKCGRVAKDPSEGWYKGELWFYDNYIIPLAQKLSECGVFGVSSDEFLNYATMNRSEWERKGQGIVEMLKREFENC